jgi:hypothetical protein
MDLDWESDEPSIICSIMTRNYRKSVKLETVCAGKFCKWAIKNCYAKTLITQSIIAMGTLVAPRLNGQDNKD